MIEKELKILLSESQYIALKEKFAWDEIIAQTNFYYGDSSNYLRTNDITVRIRVHDDHMKLQVKMPVSKHGSIHVREEYEREFKVVPYEIDKETLCDLCNDDKLPSVYLLGYLYTERRMFKYNNDCTIFLDRNVYAGMVDYEIEVEFTDTLDDQLLRIFNEMELRTDIEVTGKIGRFMERYIAIMNNTLDQDKQI